ncbi:hypothetical protein bcCo53_000591 [Borrelia coriaceae]|nr:hypothetical protein bcCo53_000591 [Borrelia coriaceae]
MLLSLIIDNLILTNFKLPVFSISLQSEIVELSDMNIIIGNLEYCHMLNESLKGSFL